MPGSHAPRHLRSWVACAALLVAVTSCSSESSEGGDAPGADGSEQAAPVATPTGDLAVIEQTVLEWGETAAEAFFFEEDPLSSPDGAIDFLDRGVAAARELRDALPADPELEPGDRMRYDAMLSALDAWEEDALAARAEVEERYDELTAALEAWDGEARPPQEYLDLMLRNDAGAEEFASTCAAFAAPLDLSPDCFSFSGEVPPEPGDPVDTGPVEAVFADRLWVVEPGPATDVRPGDGILGIDYGTTGVSLSAPRLVADPDGERQSEGALRDGIAWPEDLAAWATAMGVDVVRDDTVDLPSGTWHHVVLTVAEEDPTVVLVEEDIHPEGSVSIAFGQIVVLWEATVHGTELVGVTQAREAPLEEVIAPVTEALGSIRPADE